MQRYDALQAVGPNSETTSTAGEAQRGQVSARRVGIRLSGTGPSRRGAAPGGEMPCSRSARRP